jgi:hypothetical protein
MDTRLGDDVGSEDDNVRGSVHSVSMIVMEKIESCGILRLDPRCLEC